MKYLVEVEHQRCPDWYRKGEYPLWRKKEPATKPKLTFDLWFDILRRLEEWN